jgi:hypothetical protein
MSALTTLHRIAALAAAAALLSACGSGSDTNGTTSGTPAPTTGTAEANFSVSQSVRDNMALVDPLAGKVYGAVFLAEDVSITGPRDGAEEIASVEIDLDLTAGDPSGVLWTSEELEVQKYTFLGFFDVDGNGATTHEPEAGDPVMLPFTNQFDIVAGKTTEVTIVFDLLYN